MPLCFDIARVLGPHYSLRCVLFHDVADVPSEFTDQLKVSMTKADFEAKIRFLAERYTPVSLSDILAANTARKPSRPPVLVTFDDAYASVAREAAPILRKYGVPALFFVNASLVGNRDLMLDNFICYVVNTSGFAAVLAAAAKIPGCELRLPVSFKAIFDDFLPSLSQPQVAQFRDALSDAAGIRSTDLARAAQLYVREDELRALASSGFEIGNHTHSHVSCRSLSGSDFEREISVNQAMLENIVGKPVRAFSVPYGKSADLTDDLMAHLRLSGHQAVFLVESRCNTPATDLYRLNRVSVRAETDADFFTELEILPRLRSLRDFMFQRPNGHTAQLPAQFAAVDLEQSAKGPS